MSKHMRFGVLALVGALALGVTACDTDEILEVEDPDIVTPGGLTGPTGLATLRAGAIGDFALALAGNNGGTEGQILVSGLLSDEFWHSGTFQTRQEVDIRDISEDNGTMTGVFQNLSRARQAAEQAAKQIEENVENPSGDSRIAEMRNLAGYAYIMFGENYCSGVPVSTLDESGNLVPGEPLTTEQIFGRAVERFDAAAGNTAGDEDLANLAAVGKGRALVNLGQYGAAAAAVASVPTDWEYIVHYSTNSGRQENGVHSFNIVVERWSVADGQGGAGLAFRRGDPRVEVERTGGDDLGFDEVTPQWNLLKYPNRDSPISLATGAEARYIEAEAALASGDAGTFMDKLNEVRAMYDMEELEDPGSATAREDLLFEERAFTLFATGHRLGDMRRLIRQYGRTANDVFPTGTYHKPQIGSFGTDVNIPVPFQERNNANFTGCLNRDA